MWAFGWGTASTEAEQRMFIGGKSEQSTTTTEQTEEFLADHGQPSIVTNVQWIRNTVGRFQAASDDEDVRISKCRHVQHSSLAEEFAVTQVRLAVFQSHVRANDGNE